MKFKVNLVPPPEPMETDPVLAEARAQIIWGESSDSVRETLIAKGFSADEAGAVVRKFNQERNAGIRRLGIKNVLIGALCLSAAGLLLYFTFTRPQAVHSIRNRGGGLGMVIFGGFYGLWKLIRGILYLASPQSEAGSLPDMSE